MKVLIALGLLGVLSLFIGLTNLKKSLYGVLIAGIAGVTALTLTYWNQKQSIWSNMMDFDNFSVAFTAVILITSLLIVILSRRQFDHDLFHLGDIYGIILFTLAGAIMMVSFTNLVMLFIGIETLSISLYILAGSRKESLRSNEAALKYFVLGAFATGFLLFGIVLLYGVTGSFETKEIAAYASANPAGLSYLFYTGLFLLMVALLFKVSAAPFHFWAPDVYDGSPTIITSLMATVVKIAGFAAFFRLFMQTFPTLIDTYSHVLSGVAMLTLIIGNFTALYQSNLKRLLAYSSVAHAGYLLLAIIVLGERSDSALLYYAASYGVSSLGAFVVLLMMSRQESIVDISSLQGFGKRHPVMAVLFSIILMSLAGIPPTSGFFAKYYLFSTAVEAGHYWLVLVAILTSLVSIYYYFRVVAAMFTGDAVPQDHVVQPEQKFVLASCAALSLILGIVPGTLLYLI